MNIHETDLPTVYLKPGELFISTKPTVVSTVLGSCVSVTMFNSRLRVGAIFHAIMPLCKKMLKCAVDCDESFKYVDCSIRHMMERFKVFGIKRNEIEVKIFGGAAQSADRNIAGNMPSVGTMNIEKALTILETERFLITKSHVGGSHGRKIVFYTHTGEVFMKSLCKGVYTDSQGPIIKSPCRIHDYGI